MKTREKLSGYHVARNETEGWKIEGESFCFASDSLFLQSEDSAPRFGPAHHQLRGGGYFNQQGSGCTHFNRVKFLSPNCFLQIFLFLSSSQYSSPCSKPTVILFSFPSAPQANYFAKFIVHYFHFLLTLPQS